MSAGEAGPGTPAVVVSAASGEIVAAAPPPELALEAMSVSKHFGALAALSDVSLRLRRGTVHALLGENGAGKSTLVKCIMGYYQADAGRVLVGGVPSLASQPNLGDSFSMEQMERLTIQQALRVSAGNRTKAAGLLGISRDTLYRKLRQYQM